MCLSSPCLVILSLRSVFLSLSLSLSVCLSSVPSFASVLYVLVLALPVPGLCLRGTLLSDCLSVSFSAFPLRMPLSPFFTFFCLLCLCLACVCSACVCVFPSWPACLHCPSWPVCIFCNFCWCHLAYAALLSASFGTLAGFDAMLLLRYYSGFIFAASLQRCTF